jgi:hypothetical protein
MTSARDQALAALGLATAPDADATAIQSAFERLARRYPQPHFPDRFRQLLDARDQLLDAGRAWREQLEGRTLDLAWMLPYLKPLAPPEPAADRRRKALQDMLRAGYHAEPLDPGDDPFDF